MSVEANNSDHDGSPATPSLVVGSFYQFTALAAPAELRAKLLERCRAAGVRGTVLLAAEGINGSIAGSTAAVSQVLDYLRAYPLFADLEVRIVACAKVPFRRLKIRMRDEIVSFGAGDIDPARRSGTRLVPHDFNALLERDDVVLIDARNDYEFRLGSFRHAVNPGTDHFREFPAFVAERLKARPDQPVAMFCTGGIRCEKASAYLLEQGYGEVYQLDGGILRYLAEIPAQESRWQGECFVFDQRVAVDHRLEPTATEQCHGCRRPVTIDDRDSPLFERGISCPACHASLSETQRRAFAERRRQVALAATRHQPHIGAVMVGEVD